MSSSLHVGIRQALVTAAVALLSGCSAGEDASGPSDSGGAAAAPPAGGTTAAGQGGGAPIATGGGPAAGGAVSGGTAPSGGLGAAPNGGAGPSGGAGGIPTGGALSGGASPTGGVVGMGGAGGVGDAGGAPPQRVPCGEGWGEPVPGSVDLGLASSPETVGISGGSADERAIFDQLNVERVAVGLAPLGWSDQVANVARSHAADMNQLDYFDHGSSTRPYRVDGVTNRDNWLPFPRLDFAYPGDFRRAGENIARTSDPVGRVKDMWMGSDGHRAAILDEYGWTADVGGIGIDGSTIVFNPAQCAR